MCVKKRETEIQNKNSSSISFTTAAAPDDSSAQEEGDEGGRKSSRQKAQILQTSIETIQKHRDYAKSTLAWTKSAREVSSKRVWEEDYFL